MRITVFTIGIFISMILLAIFITYVINLLSTSSVASEDYNKTNINITDSPDHLLWFLQVSDIHISIFKDPNRITEFKEFCDLTVGAIKPSVVLASGDLTDAKTKDGIGSEQYEAEWRYYRDILKETRIKDKTLWLDIRGNHDNFNVADLSSKQNFFTNYSIQGKLHPKSYMYQIKKRNVLYTFMGIDACLEPGPKRPFNFIGMLDDVEINEINSLIDKTELGPNNYTVFFGHFPTSCIVTTSNDKVRDILGRHKQGIVYVCGHLHKLGGLIPKMYTLQKAGFLELELGDWMDNRVYRLMAIDHGFFSFKDIQHRDWPVFLVTNPKEALFINPGKENLEVIRNSTHIRILAFSLSMIDFVKVKINDGEWINCKRIKGPLFAVPWNPKNYLRGFHNMEVYVKDIDGRIKSDNQIFALDGTPLSFGILSKLALMTDATLIFKVFFFGTLILTTVPAFAIRYVHLLVADGKLVKPKIRKSLCFSWFRKFWIMSTVDRIFWPIVIYPIYLAIGPWTVGYLVENHVGAIFAWGIFVHGAFLPGAFTYAYGFLQLVSFHIPLLFVTANTVYFRFQEVTKKIGKKQSIKKLICRHLPFSVIFLMQVIMAYLFWLAYGSLAFLLGPLRTWSLVLAGILYYQSLRLPEKCIRRAAEVWYVPSNINITESSIELSTIQKTN
ncbi:transmembrane protein 62-like isoform X1 [Diorhabda carinulata]|uniref:transmembrane protein 62-like isoform X1 n=1 Tax=Diorhabda carinulata TaxID=1163345 RepID=UPI0025A2CC6D|nr:transmembrane protein 62-like isoform X1 [Diorhabda carinulata]